MIWKTAPLTANIFELLAGVVVEHRVHYTASSAISDSALRRVVTSVVDKAVSFAKTNLSSAVTALLFHFDPVEATLRGIYCDSRFQNDSTDVVVCSLSGIGSLLDNSLAPRIDDDDTLWRIAASRESSRVKDLLVFALMSTDLSSIGLIPRIVFSDDDRSDNLTEFHVHELLGSQ